MTLKRNFLFLPFAYALLLTGCVVNTSGPTSSPPPIPSPTVASAPSPALTATSSLPAKTIPVTWASLDLSGKLVFVTGSAQGSNFLMQIQELDLSSGSLTTIFQAPNGGWIDSAAVSPDGRQIVTAYSPPASQSGQAVYPTALYNLPIDGSQPPQQLVALPLPNDQDIEPVWSPDGTELYYVLSNFGLPPAEPNQHYPIDQIFRVAYPNGQPEKLLDKAYWPRLSADGSRLVYVSENPDDGSTKLFMADKDGGHAHQIQLSGSYIPTIIDAPFFSADGKSILFSAPPPTQSSLAPWVDWLFGVIPVSAHYIAEEVWSVPVGGGVPIQLTHIQAPGIYSSFSPDKKYIANFSGTGVFVMEPDGSNLTMIVNDVGGTPGTVNWIP